MAAKKRRECTLKIAYREKKEEKISKISDQDIRGNVEHIMKLEKTNGKNANACNAMHV